MLNEHIKIINFQNIKSVIDKNELLAWNKLIRIPQPKLSELTIYQYIEDIILSMNNAFINQNIKIENNTTPLKLTIDKNLIEQVIVNLLKNSIDALKESENKLIKINSQKTNGFTTIRITDNGKGITDDILSKIYTYI